MQMCGNFIVSEILMFPFVLHILKLQLFFFIFHAVLKIVVLEFAYIFGRFNYYKHLLFQECPQGRYGKTCSLQCGNCLNELPCNYINGSCTSGCSPGWNDDRCNQSKPSMKIKIYIHIYMYSEFFFFHMFYFTYIYIIHCTKYPCILAHLTHTKIYKIFQ